MSDETPGSPKLTCPACRASSPEGSVSCRKCHESLLGVEPTSETAKSLPDRTCPECGAPIDSDMVDCPGCNAYVPPEACGDPEATAVRGQAAAALILRGETRAIEIVVAAGDVLGREAIGSRYMAETPTVSRKHCRFDHDPVGDVWTLMDLGSSNGTFVCDRELKAGDPQPVRPGDRIVLGDLAFVVGRIPESPGS